MLVYVALMTPWWAYNYARYGQFVRLNLAGGIVLYTGNNPLNVSGGGVGKAARTSILEHTEASQIRWSATRPFVMPLSIISSPARGISSP